MDIRLQNLVDEAAGTYFLVTDNSTATEGLTLNKVGVFFINEEKGPVNTGVYFKKGAITAFQNIFGKRTRKNEKLGNFGIYQVMTALTKSDVIVVNLRNFNSEDKIGVSGISPNPSAPELKSAQYTEIFNKNGFWTIRGKNIKSVLSNEHYLNFGNVGKNNVSYFVVKSKISDVLTNQSKESLSNSTLEIEDYPALTSNEIILEDTIVDVYIFNNTFDSTAGTNRFYGQYFNEVGLLNYGDIEKLADIPEAGFIRKITGSLIPNLKNERNEVISIDSLINNYYSETGLVCYINDDILENETIGELPVLNTTLEGYYNVDGNVNSVGYMLSYRTQNVTPKIVDLENVLPEYISDMSSEFLLNTTGDIFPQNEKYGNKVFSIFENNIRSGAKILFKDKLSNKLKTVFVKNVEIIEENIPNDGGNKLRLSKSVVTLDEATNSTVVLNFTDSYVSRKNANQYIISRRTEGTGSATDNSFVQIGTTPTNGKFTDINLIQGRKYVYLVTAKGPDLIDSYSIPFEVLVDGANSVTKNNTSIVPVELPDSPLSNLTWKKALLTLSDNVNSDEYSRILDIKNYNKAKVLPTNLSAYIPRKAQFLDGSATKQKEILDMILEPSIVKGLKNTTGLRYLVDCFKTFVEPNYKYQFVSLIESLDKSNKFVRGFVNDPAYEDLDKSVNPLFKDNPGDILNISAYLAQGGNPSFSTVFLTKPVSKIDFGCYYFPTEIDASDNEYPITAKVYNEFVAKTFDWDIVANTTGVLSLNGLPFNPEPDERKAIEKFSSNPVIKDSVGFKIYGNYTGQKNRTGLFQIHNSELLAFIKDSLYQKSQDESFKKTTAQEFLATEVEYQSFMDSLALAGAIAANPIVTCSLINNPNDVQAARIKVISVSYFQINSNDKVVFDLNIN